MTAHAALGDGAEFDAIRQLLKAWGPSAVGIGDDAAILEVPAGEKLLVSTDASVEGVHFRREWLSPAEIGFRAANAALSDLAAMAAKPLGIMLALALPEAWRGQIVALGRGVGSAAEQAGCPIVGGNITAADALSLTVTVLGISRAPLKRTGVKPGDIIFVTGQLGGAAIALAALKEGESPLAAARARFATPRARLSEARWLAERRATAAIDVSDGLIADATHLARASGVSLVLNGAAVPRFEGAAPLQALASGEEYELLLAFHADALPDRQEFERKFGLALTPVGVAVPAGERPVVVTDADAGDVPGFDHLR